MKIRSKNGETMFYVEKHAKMVRFINGVVEVDDKIGKEMLACGYKKDGVTVSAPKRVVEHKQEKVVVEKKGVPPTPSTTQPKFKV